MHGKWGEVDMPTGINVIAASETMMVVLLFGAGFMQAGRYYQIIEDEKSDVEYAKLVAKAEEEEKLAEEARKEEEEKQAKKDARNAKKYGHDEGTTGSEVTETTARKTKTKKT